MRMRWNNCLTPVAREAAPDTVHVKRWSPAASLHGAVARLTLWRSCRNVREICRLIKRERGECGAILRAELHHVVIEAGDGDVAVLVMERGDHGGKRVRRIDDGATVAARVQVNFGVTHIHLHVGDPPQSHGECRQVPFKEARVADDHGVSATALRVRRHPALKVHRA